jgi:hypothetical protein
VSVLVADRPPWVPAFAGMSGWWGDIRMEIPQPLYFFSASSEASRLE